MSKVLLSYSKLVSYPTFEERFQYASQIHSQIGLDTFGLNRWLNQQFYSSPEWRAFRDLVIIRDGGCDLGIPDRAIGGRIYIHHLNPITEQDIAGRSNSLLDLNNAICVSFETHNAIHYGSLDNLPKAPVQRTPFDTCPWRK